MPNCGTQKTHRVPVRMDDRQYDILGRIREKRPDLASNSQVIITAIVQLAEAEGVPTS